MGEPTREMAGRMKIYLLLTLILLSTLPLSSPVLAQEISKAGVEMLGPSLVEAQPRDIVTLSFQVTNSAPEEREFIETIDLPEGWRLLIPMTGFLLMGGENEVRLVSVIVPPTAPAGKYTVTYIVREPSHPLVGGYIRVEVIVLPLLGLEAIIQEVPVYVTAGESYDVSFRVINRGNAPVRVTIEVESGKGFPATVDEKEFLLEAGHSKIVKVRVQTKGDLVQAENHILRLRAKTQDTSGKVIEATAVSSVEVIPRVSGAVDRYHRVPVILGIGGYEKGGNLGFQVELAGSGSLDETGDTRVDFSLRGPVLGTGELSGKPEDYRLSLDTKGITIHLGDRLFGLSSLTERGLFGRGAEISFKKQDLRMGGYYLKTLDNREEQWAGYLDYPAGDSWMLQVNGISKKASIGEELREDTILSLEMAGWLGKNAVAELEYAWGKRDCEREGTSGRAWRGILSGEYHGVNYSLGILHADPDYPGESRDMFSRYLTLSLPLKDKLRLWGNYREQQENLALDPRSPEAPWQRWIEGGMAYVFEGGTSFSLSYTDFAKKDRLSPPSFDYGEGLLRLRLGHSFCKLGLQGYWEHGDKYDNLVGGVQRVNNIGVSVSYRPQSNQGYEVRYYTGFDRFTGLEKDFKATAGLGAWYKVNDNLLLDLNIQHSRVGEANVRDQLSLRVNLRAPSASALDSRLRCSWLNGVLEKDLPTIEISYRIPLDIPVSRKKNIGLLRGKVYDAESPGKAGIKGVVLRIGKLTAVTDEEGQFVFPSVSPGNYYVYLDMRSIGEKRIPVLPTPFEITIQGGEEQEIAVGVARSASLSGRIARFGPEEGGLLNEKGAPLLEKEGLANVVVELQSDIETLRRVTDSNGSFFFEELRPGKWRLRIHDKGIPPYHYVEENNLSLNLEPGQAKELLIRVLPVERPVTIIEEMDLPLE